MLIGSYVGVNMEECIPLDDSCNWTLSSGDWASVSLTTREFPPLQLSGRLFYLYIQVAWEILGILSILNLNNFVGLRYICWVSEKVLYVAAYYISWTFSSSNESHCYVLFLWIPRCSQSVTILAILTHVFRISNSVPTVEVRVLVLLHFLFPNFCCNHLISSYVLYL